MAEIRIGTRTSQLAMWQTKHIAHLLQTASPSVRCDLYPVVTQGDRRLDRPLPEIGGKGLFTAELEQALLDGRIDLAVHSLKDLPVQDVPGLVIGAIPARADVRDVLIAREGWTLATLPPGAIVGTSSLRRQAQLAAYRPDLQVHPIRGNVDTRLRKVLEGDYHAAVMAAAGISRLDLRHHVTEWLELDTMLPAPGQGALAVQCRADDVVILALLAALDDRAVRVAVTAERQVLKRLGGGCSAPVAAYATIGGRGAIHLRARVAGVDGRCVVDAEASGEDSATLAETVAQLLLAQGAEEILVATRKPASEVQPLAGKRVLITRAAHQVGELVMLLEAAGATPLVMPTVQTVPLAEQALSGLDITRYGWIIFTSANAVRFFLDLYPQVKSGNGRRDGRPAIAAVGPATASALVDSGISVDAMPATYTGTEVPAALGDIQGARILLPRSAIADDALPAALRASGAAVDELPLYTAVARFPDEVTLSSVIAGGVVDAVLFTSPSTVRGFVTVAADAPELHALTQDAVLACIGPTTAAALAETGRSAHVTAAVHTVSGLVDALITYATNRR